MWHGDDQGYGSGDTNGSLLALLAIIAVAFLIGGCGYLLKLVME